MNKKRLAVITSLMNLTGASSVEELCVFFGMENAAKFWEPVKEGEAAVILDLSVTTLRNYRHLSRGPSYIKKGSSISYFPVVLHLYNLQHCVELQEAV